MMKSWKNRILGIIVCVALVLGTVSVPTFASEGGTVSVETVSPEEDTPAVVAAQPDDSGADDDDSDDDIQSSAAAAGGVFAAPMSTATFEEELAVARSNNLKLSSYVWAADEDQPMRGGDKAEMGFNVSYSSGQNELNILRPERLRAIITVPPGVESGVVGNDNLQKQFEMETGADGYTTIKLTFALMPQGGGGSGFTAVSFNTQNYIKGHDEVDTFKVNWVYGDEENGYHEILEESLDLVYYTDRFNWSGVSKTSPGTLYTRIDPDDESIITVPTEMYVGYKLDNAINSSSGSGVAYTKTIVMENQITISDVMAITPAMLNEITWTWTRDFTFTPVISDVQTNSYGYVSSFKTTVTIENQTLGTDSMVDITSIANTQLRMHFPELRVNAAVVNAQVAEGATKNFTQAIRSNPMTVKFYPCVPVLSTISGITNDANGVQYIEKAASTSTSTTYGNPTLNYVREKPAEETPPDPLETGAIKKTVTSITDENGKTRTGASEITHAYYEEKITYALSGFGNTLTVPLENFRIVDDFDNTQQYPTALTYGTVTPTSPVLTRVIRLYVNDNGTPALAYEFKPTSNSTTTTQNLTNLTGNAGDYVGKPIQASDICRIEYDYGEVPVGFKVNTNPTITTFVRNLGYRNPEQGEEDENIPMLNTANVFVTYDGTEYGYSDLPAGNQKEGNFRSQTTVRYYAKLRPDAGTKTFAKVAGKNPTSGTLEAGDILKFTLSFKNTTGYDAQDPFVDDKFEGLAPYLTDRYNYGLDQQGFNKDPKGNDAKNYTWVVSIKDETGKDVTADRELKYEDTYVGYIAKGTYGKPGAYYHETITPPEPVIEDGMMRIRFNTVGNYLKSGDVVEISYLMEVTNPVKFKNEFLAYAYPTNPGPPTLLEFGGGGSEGGGTADVNLKPTATLAVSVASPGNSQTSVLGDGKTTNVTLTFTHSNVPYAPPLTLYGFAPAFDKSYQDVLRIVKDQTVEVQLYESGNQTATLQKFSAKITDKPSNMSDADIVIGDGASILFVDDSGKNIPIQVPKNYVVKVIFQVTQDGLGDPNVSIRNQSLRAYALMGDGYDDYNATNRSACNWFPAVQSKFYTTTTVWPELQPTPIVAIHPRIYNVQTTVSSNTTYMRLNDQTHSYYRKRTGSYGINLYVQNDGQVNFTVDKIYIRLPYGEEFAGMSTTSYSNTGNYGYTGEPIGYFGEGSERRQIVELTPIGGPRNLAAGKTSSYNASTSYWTYIETKVSDEAARELLDSKKPPNATYTTFSQPFEVAFYSSTIDEFVSSTNAGKTVKRLEGDELKRWGVEAMDIADLSVGSWIKADTTPNASYYITYPQPGMQIQAMKEISGKLEPNTSKDAYSPEERMGWQISVRNYGTNMHNPTVVIKMPVDTTYTGIENDKYSATSFKSADGYEYVIVSLGTSLPSNSSTVYTFNLKATMGSKYGNKNIEAYLLSADYFWRAYPTPTSTTNWGTVTEHSLSNEVLSQLSFTAEDRTIFLTDSVRVSGVLMFNTYKDIKANKSHTSTSDGRGIVLTEREGNVLTYKLTLNNESGARSSVSYKNVVMIDRLPNPGDKFITAEDSLRGSTTGVTMKTTPTARQFALNSDGTTVGEEGDEVEGGYTVEYTDVAPDYDFTPADFKMGSGTEATWIAADQWDDSKVATAFRVIFHNDLEIKTAYQVTYSVDVPTKDMPKFGAEARNSFSAGFDAHINTTVYQITPEADYVRAVFPDVPEMVIQGTVFLDDPATANGIYEPPDEKHFGDFTEGQIILTLYHHEIINGVQQPGTIMDTYRLNPLMGTYKFDGIYDDGVYYVGIETIPEGYDIFDRIVDNNQGNKFFYSNGMTEEMVYEAGKTYIKNAGIIERVTGTLTIEKRLRTSMFGTDSGLVGNRSQTFVFRIDYTPLGGNLPTRTFYEVLHGDESKLIVDLPQGKYTVTEIEGWGSDYIQVGPTAYRKNIDTISRENRDIEAVISNTRDQKPFFHAIAEVVNDRFSRQQVLAH